MPKMIANKELLRPEEVKYIQDNFLTKTRAEIARELGRDARTVAAHIVKISTKVIEGGDEPKDLFASKHLTEGQRKQFFKTTLTNSLYYDNLKEHFKPAELDFYLEEWGSLCLQFEDIIATEKRQIDEYIKAEIMGNRLLRNINETESEIEKIIAEIEKFRETHDMKNDEDAQERDFQLMSMIQRMYSQSEAMGKNYQNNVDLKNKILGELNGRRKDRIDQITKRGTTFLALVAEFREKEIRERHGRHIELMRLAKENKKLEWSKPILFADGSRDPILMDENMDTSPDVLRCEIIDNFIKSKEKNILVVDDDLSRCQIFSELFKGNKIAFASNCFKAIETIKLNHFDLICLDYDLGLEQKGMDVVNHLIENKIHTESSILIHSMNKDGSIRMYTELTDNGATTNIDLYKFEDIIKIYGGQKNGQSSTPV